MADTSSPQASLEPRAAAMRFIMLTVLIDMIAIGVMVPVLPSLVGSFTTSATEQTFWYGVVTAAFGISNFFGSPILGALSDRYGRRPVLLTGFCGLALNFFATAMATSLWMVVVVRLVGGAMMANMAVANAYVADITPPEARAKRFGLLGAMFGLGFILGPVVGGLLGHFSLRLPFFVAGGLALVNLTYGYWVLPESLPVERRRAFDWNQANPVTSLRSLTHLKDTAPLVAVIAFSSLAQFVQFTSWVLYTTFKFGWGPVENGWSLAVVGSVAVIVQGALLGPLLRRLSAQRLAILGLTSSALAYVAYGALPEGWMMYAIIVTNCLVFTVSASIQSIVSSAADAGSQGETMGAISAVSSLAAVIAPMLGAPLLGLVSQLPRGDWRIGAPFYLCAALQFASLVIAFIHFRGLRRNRLATQARLSA